MQNAGTLIALAKAQAKVPGWDAQAAQLLNVILADLCDTYELAAARRNFGFVFNPTLNSSAVFGPLFGSGPYQLPIDYLRVSGSSGSTGQQNSSIWWLNGVPYSMVEIDLAEFDLQVQQSGLQSYPYFWAKDMALRQIANSTFATLAAGNPIIALTLQPNAPLPAVGMGLSGANGYIVPGSTIIAVNGANVTLQAPLPGQSPALLSGAGIPVFYGNAPIAYAYPPPSGAYPVQLRYQCMMPPLPYAYDATGNITGLSPAALAAIPWFPNQEYLLTRLGGELMKLADDSRFLDVLGDGSAGRPGQANGILKKYLTLKDDSTANSRTVSLDRRRFGRTFSTLRNSKKVGW